MSLDEILDVVSGVLLIIGALLSLAAGIGLMRFSDLLTRMHAQTKPQIAGLLFILVALGIQQTELPTILFLVPIMFFQMLTTPVAAATLARGGYRNRHFPHDELHVDALAAAIDLAEQEQRQQDDLEREERDADGPDDSQERSAHVPDGAGERDADDAR
ncbi:monovalent cation/H(+) antiporter subunit G [Pseudoclavibacter chungangensis]|uniref:Monovalent cation/H(+) antiporter subunit G n=1 Tax=Pseudoclavibacter chungangensis TaxID=587635 RepID=A0A7J5C1B0_9MICO|nr:monovalent cation/H(+) antiporter subunit G [Pseudoclavibacter chungangensis]KAB1659531.1 monovalent cation/H(+) antiporter subunit G [Pseudoclavibacter chungangensis]NYJ67606.1 multicomponent Na+:H+ antiporter subunit G [Pseudoclavibacter chungangensis]